MKGRPSGGRGGRPERRGGPGGGRGPRGGPGGPRGPRRERERPGDRGPVRRGRSESFDRAKKVLEGQEPFTPPPPGPPPPGARLAEVEEITVQVEKIVAGGEGLARYGDVPVFIPRSAPGDRLRVRIAERRPDYGRAEIVEILEPGPDRRPDPYPELARTGICDLQHLNDRAQSRLKAAAVRETLLRLGKVELPENVELIAGDPWGYRLRTQVHTEVDPVAGGVRVGYLARGTNDLVPVSRCPILVPELEALLADLPKHLGPDTPWRLDLAAGDGGAVTVAPVVPGLPQGEISTTVGDFTYFYDARTFFQGHRGLLPRLVEKTVGPWTGTMAVDLYAGVGLFALPLSRLYEKVVAVEADQIGARYGRLNVRRNKVQNVEVVQRVVESWVTGLPEGVDRVVVDPPRAGLDFAVRKALLERRPKRLTYVSCHPAALARDLRILSVAYRIESVTFFDLFPQTGHMETIVQLEA
ncbi:MAG TPA: TRAM domain-containing protein [Thermoanaerobaculia bacterium]|nr:TRAM domain-containing protein [Thermoanaerobaculia bacterium]